MKRIRCESTREERAQVFSRQEKRHVPWWGGGRRACLCSDPTGSELRFEREKEGEKIGKIIDKMKHEKKSAQTALTCLGREHYSSD